VILDAKFWLKSGPKLTASHRITKFNSHWFGDGQIWVNHWHLWGVYVLFTAW